MPGYLKFLLLVVLTFSVSACGNASRKAKPVTGTETTAASQQELEGTDPQSEITEEGKAEELASLNYEIAPLQPEIDDDPDQLLGIDPQKLVEILGDPSLVRSESPAEIWQYATKSCVLDLVLYDASTTYIEARDEQVRPMDSRKCLRKLLLSRQNR